MIHLHLNEAAGLLQCDLMQVNSSFTGVETDSRKVKPGMLFAALQGSTFDGHDYIQQAQY